MNRGWEDSQVIRLYMREIGEVALLTREEENELAVRIKKGDQAAIDQMTRANLRLVVKIAKNYTGLGLPLLDLISEGNMGLMKAVERFDPDKGGKMSTYGSWWIKQSIKRALANQSKTIRLPAHLVEKIARMRKIIHRLSEELGREPSNTEVALEMEVKPGAIAHWKNVSLRPASLDAPVREDATASFGELVGDERVEDAFTVLADRQLQDNVGDFMSVLDPREQDILKYRYGLTGDKAETLERVGERFQITRERVRQIQKAALGKLRVMLEENEMPVSADQREPAWVLTS